MALDATFGLLGMPPQPAPHLHLASQREISTLFIDNRARHWAIRLTDDGVQTLGGKAIATQSSAHSCLRRLFADRWMVFRNCSLEKFDCALIKLQREGGNGYAILEQAGVIIVSPGKTSELTGGSYCQLSLQQLDKRVVVRKRIDLSKVHGLVDADLKLRREEQWLRNLPVGAKKLFPQRLRKVDNNCEFGYISDFAHGYTISERIFHETLSVNNSLDVITNVFSALVKCLYGTRFRRTRLSCLEEDYPSRIARRFAIVASQPPAVGRLFREILAAPQLVVNGVTCLGVNSLTQLMDRGNWLKRYLPISLKELSHGDLILDDIIMDSKRGFSLVDPNGDSSTRLYDVGKMFLSLLSRYEFFKYDKFDLNVDRSRRSGEIHLTLKLAHSPAHDVYRQLAFALPAVLRQTEVLGPGDLKLSGMGLLLLNGLQNLSLPMFHLLHHQSEQRSLAFLAIGVFQLMQVYKNLDRSFCLSLEEIIDRNLLF